MKLDGDRAENWNLICESWKNYEIASGCEDLPERKRVATLLNFMVARIL